MIGHANFANDPWRLKETGLDLDTLAQTESLLRFVKRAHRLARQPRRRGALRVAGLLSQRRLRATAAALRRVRLRLPESGQTIINVPNGKLIRLLVDDEPFDVRYGKLRRHERCLDFRTGVLSREVDWRPRPGARS